MKSSARPRTSPTLRASPTAMQSRGHQRADQATAPDPEPHHLEGRYPRAWFPATAGGTPQVRLLDRLWFVRTSLGVARKAVYVCQECVDVTVGLHIAFADF